MCRLPPTTQVLRRLSEAVLHQVLPQEELRCSLVRAMLRELFACCVLRSTMMYFTPANINKVMSLGGWGVTQLVWEVQGCLDSCLLGRDGAGAQ